MTSNESNHVFVPMEIQTKIAERLDEEEPKFVRRDVKVYFDKLLNTMKDKCSNRDDGKYTFDDLKKSMSDLKHSDMHDTCREQNESFDVITDIFLDHFLANEQKQRTARVLEKDWKKSTSWSVRRQHEERKHPSKTIPTNRMSFEKENTISGRKEKPRNMTSEEEEKEKEEEEEERDEN
ncbi:MAG: hypothetical protein K0U78_14290 [Actinomycetia bacterium]|nr:hypothetical protein [Actinomycetes bacterium]